ncbi:MAG TPA: metallophosphoesterase [Myxococcota bacterium]|jgi:hypothetical protein|nr:metallophosphoesterase [Myxococcota bacterium]
MLTFSTDPAVAEKQMQAIIFYLTTFGHIDGDFDASENAFVRDYIQKLVEHRVDTAMPGVDPKLRAELVSKHTIHFHEVFEGISRYVKELFTEAVSKDEQQDEFVHAKLKLRCFEIFQSFDGQGREELMRTVDELVMADGVAHPAEVKFRAELAALLEADLGVEVVEEGGAAPPPVKVDGPTALDHGARTHPFFERFEHHYSRDTGQLAKQVSADLSMLDKAIEVLGQQRAQGNGKLAGKKSVADLAGEAPFLDGWVYVLPPKPGARYELTVLGDLHGCYSCLKAAVMQAKFFDKVNAWRKDPESVPEPKLVLLGDYIDRGMFSYNGVLRTVTQIFLTAPEHVYMLRGNHEYYLEYQGHVYGGVKPAEAINSLKPYMPTEDVFKDYMTFFDALPNMLLFDGMLFVHAGIPRDRLLKERWRDLSTLNDPDLRFQMMWSDPSTADVIPAELQQQSARFPFGRLQCQAFLQRLGCHTLVRGHEKVNEGFKRVYDDPHCRLITLFSAGGRTNDDLPPESGYRSVTPMAMTVLHQDGETTITPWVIEYEAYNDPDRNAFFKAPPEIEHRAE